MGLPRYWSRNLCLLGGNFNLRDQGIQGGSLGQGQVCDCQGQNSVRQGQSGFKLCPRLNGNQDLLRLFAA